ncbi:hypothetical protein DRQ33_06870 [bacterium]|nr:MAG: hypothetical protein DRQ33_06870 [bacterium]
MKKILSFLIVIIIVRALSATPVRIALIRGGYISYYGDWNTIADSSINRLSVLLENVDNIDVILFPEFAFAGIDGGYTDSRPQVYFSYSPDSGFIPHPWDETSHWDSLVAKRLDTLRTMAAENNLYIWASTCCERIDGRPYSYNSLPIITPQGKITRIRRKTWYSTHEDTRDTTVHLDTLLTHSGKHIAVMTTICYENGCIPYLLEPMDPPAPLWFLPHGTWLYDMEYTTAATQRWIFYEELPGLSYFTESNLWGLVSDGWVRHDAIQISCDIFRASWGALNIANSGRINVAWEPLAWITIKDEYVVIDCDVPAVEDEPVAMKSNRPPPSDEPQIITASPKISTGPVFIFGAKNDSVSILDSSDNKIASIPADDGNAIWDGKIDARKVEPGIYYFYDGFYKCSIRIIQ